MLQGSLGDIMGAAPIQLLELQKSRPQEPTLSWQASGTAPALSAAYIKATPTFPMEISERGISAYAQATSFFISPGCELLRSFPIDLGLLSQFTAYPVLLPGVGRASLFSSTRGWLEAARTPETKDTHRVPLWPRPRQSHRQGRVCRIAGCTAPAKSSFASATSQPHTAIWRTATDTERTNTKCLLSVACSISMCPYF